MSQFTDDFAAAGLALQLEYFGEEVLYRFADGSTATITAHVIRESPAPLANVPEQHVPRLRLLIARPAGKTITPTVDRVDVAVKAKGTAVTQVVTQIQYEDDAQLLLKLSGT